MQFLLILLEMRVCQTEYKNHAPCNPSSLVSLSSITCAEEAVSVVSSKIAFHLPGWDEISVLWALRVPRFHS